MVCFSLISGGKRKETSEMIVLVCSYVPTEFQLIPLGIFGDIVLFVCGILISLIVCWWTGGRWREAATREHPCSSAAWVRVCHALCIDCERTVHLNASEHPSPSQLGQDCRAGIPWWRYWWRWHHHSWHDSHWYLRPSGHQQIPGFLSKAQWWYLQLCWRVSSIHLEWLMIEWIQRGSSW